ncbi:MAG: aquaporin Z [Flavobacteriaceae bacterium]|nr:MAG: aquaporin Z [Flavobacteriaceae bacterium]
MKKLLAEFIGTMWLVLGGCGSAVLAAGVPDIGIGLVGVSLAFGLTVLTMAYAVGHISGGHFNPAVTLGLWAGGRFNASEIVPYIVAQCLGAIAGAAVLYQIVSGTPGGIDFSGPGAFATNFYEAPVYHGKAFCASSAFLVEFFMTFFFLIVILGATHKNANGKFAGIAIGLALTLIHLISIPVTNTSVNPARSLSQAVFYTPAFDQLWLFWAAPILGAIVAGFTYKFMAPNRD